MEINDGGNFGNDQYLKLLARLQNGSLSAHDMDEADQAKHDAVNAAMGTAGTIRNVGAGIKLMPSAYDLEQEAYKKAAEKAPSFFEKFGPKPVTTPGEVMPVDRFKQIIDQFKK